MQKKKIFGIFFYNNYISSAGIFLSSVSIYSFKWQFSNFNKLWVKLLSEVLTGSLIPFLTKVRVSSKKFEKRSMNYSLIVP